MNFLSIDDLINGEIAKKETKNSEFFTIKIARLGKDLKIQVPTKQSLRESYLEDSSYLSISSKLIYNYCVEPQFNNDALITKFKCEAEPYKVVTKILNETEIIAIGDFFAEELEKRVGVEFEAIKN